VSEKRLTPEIAASASPRNPKVRMLNRSSSGSFEVACRSTASGSCALGIPLPSSVTRIRVLPPSRISMSIWRASPPVGCALVRAPQPFLDSALRRAIGAPVFDEQAALQPPGGVPHQILDIPQAPQNVVAAGLVAVGTGNGSCAEQIPRLRAEHAVLGQQIESGIGVLAAHMTALADLRRQQRRLGAQHSFLCRRQLHVQPHRHRDRMRFLVLDPP